MSTGKPENAASSFQRYGSTRRPSASTVNMFSTATRGDEHLPPGTGVLPLTDLAHALLTRGFGGVVVIEVGFGRLPESSRTSAARDSLDYARIAFAP